MVKRIWISQQHALRISKPGIEVTTASPAQLAFSSDRNLLWTYFHGTAAVNTGATSTLPFPTTLSEPPIALASIRVAGNGALQFGTGFITADFITEVATVPWQIRVFRDRCEIENHIGATIAVDLQLMRLR